MNDSRPKLRACCMGSKGRPSHSLFKCSGEEESPSISTGTRAGAVPEAALRRPRAGLGGSLREPLCHSLALGPHEAFKLPPLWRAAPGAQAPLGSATDKRRPRRLGCLCPYQSFSGPSQTSRRGLPKPSRTPPGSLSELPGHAINKHRKGSHQRAVQHGC